MCVWRSLSKYVLCTLYWWKPGKCPSQRSFAFGSPVPGLPDGSPNARHVLGHFALHASVISGTSILLSQGATLKHMQRKTNEFFFLFLFSSSPFRIYWELSMCQMSTLELEEISELRSFSLKLRRWRLKEWIGPDHSVRELWATVLGLLIAATVYYTMCL